MIEYMPWITAGTRIAEVSSGVAVLGAFSDGGGAAYAAAAVSVGAILVPRIIDWMRMRADANREGHAADLRMENDILAEEVRRRAELEVKAAVNAAKILALETAGHEAGGKIIALEVQLAKLKGTVRSMTPDPDTQQSPQQQPAH